MRGGELLWKERMRWRWVRMDDWDRVWVKVNWENPDERDRERLEIRVFDFPNRIAFRVDIRERSRYRDLLLRHYEEKGIPYMEYEGMLVVNENYAESMKKYAEAVKDMSEEEEMDYYRVYKGWVIDAGSVPFADAMEEGSIPAYSGLMERPISNLKVEGTKIIWKDREIDIEELRNEIKKVSEKEEDQEMEM